MYLVELDSKTGLVKVNGAFDGVMAIREFRDVINDETLGIKCFTSIALTVDYLTPIKYYREKDRPYRAMGMANEGDRKAFDWNQEKIQQGLIAYNELQYNASVEEKKALDFMLLEKLQEIKLESDNSNTFGFIDTVTESNIEEMIIDNYDIKGLLKEHPWEDYSDVQQKSIIRKANQRVVDPYNKRVQETADLKSQEKVLALFKQLNTIKALIENFNKSVEGTDIYATGPVINGYTLSRLEEKRLDKNSFYNKEDQ